MGGETLQVINQKNNLIAANKPASRTSLFYRKMWRPALKTVAIFTFSVIIPLAASNLVYGQEKIPKYTLEDFKHDWKPKSSEKKITAPPKIKNNPQEQKKKNKQQKEKTHEKLARLWKESLQTSTENNVQNTGEESESVGEYTYPDRNRYGGEKDGSSRYLQNLWDNNRVEYYRVIEQSDKYYNQQSDRSEQYEYRNGQTERKESRRTFVDDFGCKYEIEYDSNGNPKWAPWYVVIGRVAFSLLIGAGIAGVVIGILKLIGAVADRVPSKYDPNADAMVKRHIKETNDANMRNTRNNFPS